MSEIDSGGPMFPSDKTEWVPYDIPAKGITIRQWFAGMALQGLLSGDPSMSLETSTIWAYQHADAMIKAGKGERCE